MDDKKKIAALAALFIVMIGVGAFQFIKSGSPEAPAPKAAAATEQKSADVKTEKVASETGPSGQQADEHADKADTAEETKPEVDPALVAAARLGKRDPFDGRQWDKSLVRPDNTPAPAPIAPPIQRPRRSISGQLPFDPTKVGVLPEGGGPAITPGGKLPNLDEFPYTVSGTILGDRPCVVVTDAEGKQKVVPVGGSIDGDSQVLSISKGKVTVRHRGKTKTFSVGGMNPSETKQEGN